MVNLLETIKPKSDQLNSDDLRGRNLTITIRDLKLFSRNGEMAFKLYYHGDGGKPYIPSKGMRRITVEMWGGESDAYMGQKLTLARDPKVKLKGVEVGGIIIVGATGIPKDMEYAVRISRDVTRIYTVKRIIEEQSAPVTPEASAKAKEAAQKIIDAIAECASVEDVQATQAINAKLLQRLTDSYSDLADKVSKAAEEKLKSLGYFTGDDIETETETESEGE